MVSILIYVLEICPEIGAGIVLQNVKKLLPDGMLNARQSALHGYHCENVKQNYRVFLMSS
jgi:hypothetical protein